MAYDVTQITNIVNDAVKDALGKTNGVTKLDASDFVSLGKALTAYNALDGWFGALAKRIVETVYFVRGYQGNKRSVLRDEHEYGAFVQKVYYTMPEAVDNATWEIPDSTGTYAQASPYDVETSIAVSAKVFGGKGTFSIEFVRPIEQIKNAFLSAENMASFIDGLYMTAENKFNLAVERLCATAVNTAMANAIKGGKSRNLLAEYNTLNPTATIATVADALQSADFLKYASKEINRCIDNMAKMSTAFNVEGYETFTDKENLVVEMLSEFASATDMYLQADTFHNELTSLPNYEKTSFWQSSGNNFAFADTSKISIQHDDWADESTSDDGTVTQGGIVCFIHDKENVACYFGNRRSWEMVNPRSEVVIHGEKAEEGYAVDGHANSVVFYLAV